MFIALTLLPVCLAEEASRLIGAVGNPTDELNDTWAAAEKMYDINFRRNVRTTITDTNGGGKKEVSVELTEPHKFQTIAAFVWPDGDSWSRTWNDVSIWMG